MIQIRAFPDANVFVRDVATPMAADAVANNVFLILADQMAAKPQPDHLRYGAFADVTCVLAAWLTPPFRLGLADLGGGGDAARVLAHHLKSAGAPIPGTTGPKRLTDAFASAWGAKADPRFTVEQNFYRVERVQAPAAVPGTLRLAHPQERDRLCEWLRQMGEDTGVSAAELGKDVIEPRADRALSERCAFFWEADGRPVACALERPFRSVGSRISTVFTDRALRGRGYGGALTAALSQRILDKGHWCVLFADADNALTNRLYQRLGYRFQAVYSDIHFVQD